MEDTQEVWVANFEALWVSSPSLTCYHSKPKLHFNETSWAVYSTLWLNNLYSIFYHLCISGDLNDHMKRAGVPSNREVEKLRGE